MVGWLSSGLFKLIWFELMIDWLIDWLIREVYPDGESTSPYVFICKNPQVNYLTVIEIQISWSLFFVSTWQLAVRYWFGLKVIFKSFPRINFKRKYCFGYLNVFFFLSVISREKTFFSKGLIYDLTLLCNTNERGGVETMNRT